VTGRDGLAVVQPPGTPEERAELHIRIAVDTRAGGLAAEIRCKERLEDPRVELALEVHDVEGDPESGGDPPRVVRGIERAAALLELAGRVGHVVEAHPHPDDVVALACGAPRLMRNPLRPTSRPGSDSCGHALAQRAAGDDDAPEPHRGDHPRNDIAGDSHLVIGGRPAERQP
jgi:hypothetical protein